jgi:hypothetical protein
VYLLPSLPEHAGASGGTVSNFTGLSAVRSDGSGCQRVCQGGKSRLQSSIAYTGICKLFFENKCALVQKYSNVQELWRIDLMIVLEEKLS